MSKKTWIVIVLFLTFSAAITAYFIKGNEPPESTMVKAGTPEPLPLLLVGSVAPEFSLRDTRGKTMTISAFQNQKSVLLEFLSTQCSHCKASISTLKILQQEFPKELQILAVNAGDRPPKPSTAKAFQSQYGITYPLLDHPASELLEQYRITGFPTFYLIDRRGVIVWSQAGALDYDGYQSISQILKRSK